jgi:hypothetical protein
MQRALYFWVGLGLLSGCGGRVDVDLPEQRISPTSVTPGRPQPPTPVAPAPTAWPTAQREGPTICSADAKSQRLMGKLPAGATSFAVRESTPARGTNASIYAAADRTVYTVSQTAALPFLVETEPVTNVYAARSLLGYYLPNAAPYTSVWRSFATGERTRSPGAKILSASYAFDTLLVQGKGDLLEVVQNTRTLQIPGLSLLDIVRSSNELIAVRTLSPKTAVLLTTPLGPRGSVTQGITRIDVNFESRNSRTIEYPVLVTRPLLAIDVGADSAYVTDAAAPSQVDVINAPGRRPFRRVNGTVRLVRTWGACVIVVAEDECDAAPCGQTVSLQVLSVSGGADAAWRVPISNTDANSIATTSSGLFVRGPNSELTRYDFPN